MNSALRLVALIAIFATIFMFIVKFYPDLTFIISGIASAYTGISINDIMDRHNKERK